MDQSRDALDPNKTVWEEISEGYEHIKVGNREINSRAYVSGFNFKKADQQRKVGVLYPAVSATACTWPSCCAAAATCCCSTSRPTTSTWTPCVRWKRPSSTSQAAR